MAALPGWHMFASRTDGTHGFCSGQDCLVDTYISLVSPFPSLHSMNSQFLLSACGLCFGESLCHLSFPYTSTYDRAYCWEAQEALHSLMWYGWPRISTGTSTINLWKALEPWMENKGAEIIDLSNRYLTPVSKAGDMEDINILLGIDPKGILYNLARRDGTCTYIHTEDNQVSYYNGHRDSTGNHRCVTFMQPASNNLWWKVIHCCQIWTMQPTIIPHWWHHASTSLFHSHASMWWETQNAFSSSINCTSRQALCKCTYLDQSIRPFPNPWTGQQHAHEEGADCDISG